MSDTALLASLLAPIVLSYSEPESNNEALGENATRVSVTENLE